MISLVMALLISAPAKVERDSYGVPKITANSFAEAMYEFGKAVSSDRLWQMENSRRVAQGKLAEIIGVGALNADKETVLTSYTDQEYSQMFDELPEKAKTAFREYTRGVNDDIKERKAAGTLPQGYKDLGFEPEPWTVTDSMAIQVMLSRRFGSGGAGELRNLAMYLYLKNQPCREKVLDVVDDLAWQNDPKSIPTVSPEDDPLKSSHPVFPDFTRADTLKQMETMPEVQLFELIPAIKAATGDDSKLIAEMVQAPFETGSYCVAVSKSRSTSGRALLMSAPQMGHTTPSIIHEAALVAPGLNVAGIDVPGIPAIVIGNTPNFAWGLTTGVADIADIVYAYRVGDKECLYGTETRPIERTKREIKVKGRDSVMVEVIRTHQGPVLLESRTTNSIFSQKMSYWKKEASSWAGLYELYEAKTPDQIEKSVSGIAMNMNFFYATTGGDIGWHYLGKMPIRTAGSDPRFPVNSKPENEWKGFLAFDKMPHVRNPKSGLIANWNNKPAAWWPNLDTPVWGAVFRNEVLLQSLTKSKLAPWDLERAAWDIARKETDTNSSFLGAFSQALTGQPEADTLPGKTLMSFDGWAVQGSGATFLYREVLRQVRKDLFSPYVGNFTGDNLFERAIQGQTIMNALQGKTKFDFLAGRTANGVILESFRSTVTRLNDKYGLETSLWPTGVGEIFVTKEPSIPYSNRGTYIQISELSPIPIARSVASPGVSESGAHATDQANLARQWLFKPMWRMVNLDSE